MPQTQIPLANTVSEQDISGRETLINLTPRVSTGGKYPFNLFGSPGLEVFVELPRSPVLAMTVSKGRAYAVTPTKFYEINSNGTYTELGDVNLSGVRVVMAENGVQIVAVDGIRAYYYDVNTELVSQITDSAFYPAATVTFQDGYFVFERKGTGQFFISELLSVAFDPLDFATAEGQPDNLVAVFSDHRELFLFGTETIEVWFNSGDPDFPFERNQGAFIEKGCAARYTVAKQDNTVFFVGSDLIVYKMEGYVPARISSHALEETLKGVDLSDAFAYTYQKDGQLFYVLTIPSSNITWSYSISTNTWDIRSSYNKERHRSNNSIFFSNKTLVGDYLSGKIFVLDSDVYTDDGEVLVRELIFPTLNVGREYIAISSFEIDMTTGVGLNESLDSNPLIEMRFSRDGGETWSNWKQASLGKIGKYRTRVKWNRLGTARQFIFHVRVSDPVLIDIGGAYVEIEQ